jgi:hypothetical protein
MMRIAKRAAWFDLGRHDVRSTLPAQIRAIMQNGLLVRAFEDALFPALLYAAIGDNRPWSGNLGDTATFTRDGLLAPVPTAITGSDPTPATYSIEQWSLTMDQYGNAVDTNMLQSAMTLQSKFVRDIRKLGLNAGQTINQIARNRLYKAYSGGRTYITAAATSANQVVQSTDGFETVLVNGVPTAVSATNPLAVTVNGVANTVIGVNTGTKTLTLGSSITTTIGQAVISAVAPVTIRPTGRTTANDVVAGDLVTMAQFRAAVARLRAMNVPTIDGNYVAHIDATTEQELFSDADFKQAYQGRGDSRVFAELSIGTFLGIDWVRNIEAPTLTNVGGVTVRRPIVCGAEALINGPFEGMADLLAGTGVEDVPSIEMANVADAIEVALIVRPPQDRLQQVLGSAWSWTGDFACPTDSTTGDASLYKRAVVVEHA